MFVQFVQLGLFSPVRLFGLFWGYLRLLRPGFDLLTLKRNLKLQLPWRICAPNLNFSMIIRSWVTCLDGTNDCFYWPLSVAFFWRPIFGDFATLLQPSPAGWKYPSSLRVACCGDRTRIDGVGGPSSWLEPSSSELIAARGSGTDRCRRLANDIRLCLAVGFSAQLNFTNNRMWMKLFKSSNINLVKECHSYFRCVCYCLVSRSKKDLRNFLVSTINQIIHFAKMPIL